MAEAVVPALWPLEVANTLLMGERRKRSSQMDTVAWMGFLSALPITVDTEAAKRAFGDIANLARTHRLTVYDATYLELAMRLGIALATLDGELKAAAKAVGVALYTECPLQRSGGRRRIEPRLSAYLAQRLAAGPVGAGVHAGQAMESFPDPTAAGRSRR